MYLLGELSVCLMRTGRWSEALEATGDVPESAYSEFGLLVAWAPIEIAAARGDVGEARRLLTLLAPFEASADMQDRWGYAVLKAALLRAEGEFEGALGAAEDALEALGRQGFVSGADVKARRWPRRSSLRLRSAGSTRPTSSSHRSTRSLSESDRLCCAGSRPASVPASEPRAVRRTVEQGFKTAAAIFREHSLIFDLAVTELEHGEWLVRQGRSDEAEPLLAEAQETFERLEATPWLERALAIRAPVEEPV